MPPVRRVISVDGVAPRSIQRPAPIRPGGERPVLGRPTAPPSLQPPQPAPVTESSAPVVPPVPLPAAGDDVQLALAGPTPGAVETPVVTGQPLTFEPVQPKPAEPEVVKKKRKLPSIPWRKLQRTLIRRKVLVPAGIGVVILLAGYGVFALVAYQRNQASPDTIYKDAMVNALMTKQLEVDFQSSALQSITKLDLTALKSPRISGEFAATIGGARYHFNTYGSTQNTFMSYTSIPAGISATTAGAVTNHWVTLRKGGQLPAAINTSLSNAADPRYQAFGPLLFANLPEKTSRTIAKFLVENHVYSYKLVDVKSVPLGSKKALLYRGTFNADYAKLANQSVATTEGLDVSGVQRVVDALDAYKGASSELYIDRGTRMPVKLVLKTKSGQTITYNYSSFNSVQLPSQPSSDTDWPQFAATQLQIEAQASAVQTADQRDGVRQNSLAAIQAAVQQYHDKTGSYPSLANLNNQTWVAANLPSFDPDTTRDPQAGTLALLAAAPVNAATTTVNPKTKVKTVVTATPIYGYVYQATNDAGKACSNEAGTAADQLCTHYTLTATLSSGKPYSVTSP